MSAEVAIRIAAGSALAAAGAAGAAALLDFEQLRAVAAWLAGEDRPHWFDRQLHARGVAALRGLAIGAVAIAVALFAFRRTAARALAVLAADAVAATRTVGGDVRRFRIDRTELALAAVVIAAGVALAARNLSLPFRYDEAATVNIFASRSFLVALSYYPAPNNHILHTLLVAVAHELGGWNPVALRLPAFVSGCLVLPAMWWFARSEYGWPAAAYGTALVATSPLFIEYVTNARGYSLLLLLFVLLLLCGRAILRSPDNLNNRALWFLYSLVIALGFLTIPIYAFPVAITVVWMLLVHWRETGAGSLPSLLARVVVWSLVAILLTLVLYAPALALSGVDTVFGNPYVQSLPRGMWAGRIVENVAGRWSYWHAANPDWAQAVLLAAIVVAVTRRSAGGAPGRGWILAAATVLGTVAVMLLKPVLLRDRMSVFLLLPAMVIAGAGIAVLLDRTLAALRWRRAGSGCHACACLLLLGGFGWWATRPGVAVQFAQETGFSPNAPAFAVRIPHYLRPGDYFVEATPTSMVVRFYANRAGLELVQASVELEDRLLPVYRFGRQGPDARGRLFLFVDDEADWEVDVRHHLGDDYVPVAGLEFGSLYRRSGLVVGTAR